MRDLRCQRRRIAHPRLGDRDQELLLRRVIDRQRLHADIGRRARGGDLTGHHCKVLLHRLEFADRAAELFALAGIGHRGIECALHRPCHKHRACQCARADTTPRDRRRRRPAPPHHLPHAARKNSACRAARPPCCGPPSPPRPPCRPAPPPSRRPDHRRAARSARHSSPMATGWRDPTSASRCLRARVSACRRTHRPDRHRRSLTSSPAADATHAASIVSASGIGAAKRPATRSTA